MSILDDDCRADHELRCTESECDEYVRNSPHGDYASCPKGHGKLHQRLNHNEDVYVTVKTIPAGVREPFGAEYFYRVAGVPGLWKLGKVFESKLFADIAAAVKRGRILAKVGEEIFRMKPAFKPLKKPTAEPVPVPVLPSQQELPLEPKPQEATEWQPTQT